MRIDILPGKMRVKSKVRRYAPAQQSFLNKYVDTLVEFGFLKPNPDAEWQAAQHLVPKNSKANYRMTIDLRPVNAATVKKA